MPQHLKLLRLLRRAYPDIKVRVSRATLLKPKKLHGRCWKVDDGKFLLQLDRYTSGQLLTETILHEFAHAPSWDEWETTGEHGPLWGEHYAKCYQIWEQNFTG